MILLPAVLGDVRGPLDAVVPHLADEVQQVLRGEGRRSHHQLVQDAAEGPLRRGGSNAGLNVVDIESNQLSKS